MNIFKNNTIKTIVIFGLVAVGLTYWSYIQNRCITKENELIVGVMSGYEPYTRINGQGEFEGFDIDVAKEIAKKLNKKLVIRDMSISTLIIAIQQGKIDLLLSALSITPDTKKAMALVYYQGDPVRSFPLIFWKKIPEGVTGIEDLSTYQPVTICTESGTKKERFLQQYDFIQVRSMNVISEIIMDLKYGKSMAIFLDPEIMPVLKKQNPELVSIDIPVPEEYQSEGFGIGIDKNNATLIKTITNIIAELKQDSTLDTLEQKWFEEYQ